MGGACLGGCPAVVEDCGGTPDFGALGDWQGVAKTAQKATTCLWSPWRLVRQRGTGGRGGPHHAGGLLANQEVGRDRLLVLPLRFLLWGATEQDDWGNAQNPVKAGFWGVS